MLEYFITISQSCGPVCYMGLDILCGTRYWGLDIFSKYGGTWIFVWYEILSVWIFLVWIFFVWILGVWIFFVWIYFSGYFFARLDIFSRVWIFFVWIFFVWIFSRRLDIFCLDISKPALNISVIPQPKFLRGSLLVFERGSRSEKSRLCFCKTMKTSPLRAVLGPKSSVGTSQTRDWQLRLLPLLTRSKISNNAAQKEVLWLGGRRTAGLGAWEWSLR